MSPQRLIECTTTIIEQHDLSIVNGIASRDNTARKGGLLVHKEVRIVAELAASQRAGKDAVIQEMLPIQPDFGVINRLPEQEDQAKIEKLFPPGEGGREATESRDCCPEYGDFFPNQPVGLMEWLFLTETNRIGGCTVEKGIQSKGVSTVNVRFSMIPGAGIPRDVGLR